MSSFHGVTRPDVPRIPQDLATKLYVDSQLHPEFVIIKTVDQVVNNSITLQNDDDFVFAVRNGFDYFGYMFEFILSPSAADIRDRWVLPAATLGRRLAAAAAGDAARSTTGITATFNHACNGTQQSSFQPFKMEVFADGNAQWQWGQQTATVGDTTIFAGSSLIVWEVER